MKLTNEAVTVRIGAPLLRAGLTVETTASKRYAVVAMQDLLDIVREFNRQAAEAAKEETK